MTNFTYFEPLSEGHCTFWAQIVLKQALLDQRISKIDLLTNPVLAERLEPFCRQNGIQVTLIDPQQLSQMCEGSLWRRAWAQWRTALSLRAATEGAVFLPFFDHTVIAAALDIRRYHGLGSISGVIFRPPNLYNLPNSISAQLSWIRRWFSYIMADKGAVGRLFTLDETVPQSWIGQKSRALTYLPDPAPDFPEACVQERRRDGRAIYLLFGSLTERKGIFQMITAWSKMDIGFHESAVLRMVGRIGRSDRSAFLSQLSQIRMQNPHIVIEVVDKFVTDETLAREVQNCSVVLAPYQNHIGSSGVLYWAAAFRRPVISQRTGLMGYQVERYHLGQTVNGLEPSEIAAALIQSFSYKQDPDFHAAHSSEAFAKVILEGVLSR